MNLNHSSAQQGFTLIEVMVSLLIVSVALLALASMLITNISANMQSEQRIDHSVLAQSAMNRTVALVKANGATYTEAAAQTALTAQFVNITDVTPTVTLNPDPVVAGTATIITIQLQWIIKGQTKTVTLRSAAVPE